LSTKAISSTKAQNNFGRVLDDVVQNNTRYIITRRNSSQVILLSLSDFEALLGNELEQDDLSRLIREVAPTYNLGETLRTSSYE
jgi:prevent-host-death family protein